MGEALFAGTLFAAVNVAWEHVRCSRDVVGALLVGIFWLSLMVLLRRG